MSRPILLLAVLAITGKYASGFFAANPIKTLARARRTARASTTEGGADVDATADPLGDDFNPKDYYTVVKPEDLQKEVYDKVDASLKDYNVSGEEVFRVYPYADLGLPVLNDCNNYFSGRFEDNFWHQNSDHVNVFIPLNDDEGKRDISIDFKVTKITIQIGNRETMELDASEKLIIDGSFWCLEEDKSGNRYVQLDIEKRFRMINWKKIFGKSDPDTSEFDDETKSRMANMLSKLAEANKGMSKLTGQSPETIDEMIKSGVYQDVLSQEVDEKAKVVGVEDDEGNDIDLEALREDPELAADLAEIEESISLEGLPQPGDEDFGGNFDQMAGKEIDEDGAIIDASYTESEDP